MACSRSTVAFPEDLFESKLVDRLRTLESAASRACRTVSLLVETADRSGCYWDRARCNSSLTAMQMLARVSAELQMAAAAVVVGTWLAAALDSC